MKALPMSESPGHGGPDLRPVILVCAYDPADVAWDPVEDLSGEPWSPPGARLVFADAAPGASAEAADLAAGLTQRLGEPACRGLLLIGRAGEAGFEIQTRAENRMPGGKARIDPTAPGVARATAPAAEMARALHAAGLKAALSSESADDAGDYLLYSVLNALPETAEAPAVGLLRAPAGQRESVIAAGVKAALSAMAAQMSPLPRRRVA